MVKCRWDPWVKESGPHLPSSQCPSIQYQEGASTAPATATHLTGPPSWGEERSTGIYRILTSEDNGCRSSCSRPVHYPCIFLHLNILRHNNLCSINYLIPSYKTGQPVHRQLKRCFSQVLCQILISRRGSAPSLSECLWFTVSTIQICPFNIRSFNCKE